MGRRRGAPAGRSQLRCRHGGGRGAGPAWHVAGRPRPDIRDRTIARHLWTARRGPRSGPTQLSVRVRHGAGGASPDGPGARRGSAGAGLRPGEDLAQSHPAAAATGDCGRRPAGGAIHAQRFRGRFPARIRDVHLGDLHPVRDHFRPDRGVRPLPGPDCRCPGDPVARFRHPREGSLSPKYVRRGATGLKPEPRAVALAGGDWRRDAGDERGNCAPWRLVLLGRAGHLQGASSFRGPRRGTR